ncbi:MAG: hypothetical protein V4671_30225 [Armatimonadota bacterium]
MALGILGTDNSFCINTQKQREKDVLADDCPVIRSHYAEGKTFRQIAEAEGVSHQRGNQWHQSALKTLRERVPNSLAN